jgi:ABC-type dipeptide/oligopeptide/nickel transport system permease component
VKAFLFRRILSSLPSLLGACTLVFVLIHLIPGDPVQVMLGEQSSVGDQRELRSRLGLDRPLTEQYGLYLRNLSHFDLGTSLRYHQPVRSLIASRYPATLTLAGCSLLLACALALPAGILAGILRGRFWQQMANLLPVLALSLPGFWLGPVLILWFSVRLNWLPVSGMDEPVAWLLPSVTLGIGLAASLFRMLRVGLTEEMAAPSCRAAASRGVKKRSIVMRHCLKAALVPAVTLIGLQLGVLLTGAVITETVFGWPGIGRLTVQAIESRDYPLVQGCVLSYASTYVLVNLAADIAYAYLDPRIRFA